MLSNPLFILFLILFLLFFLYSLKHEEYIPGVIFFVFASLGAVLKLTNLGEIGMLKAVLLFFPAIVLFYKNVSTSTKLPITGMALLFSYLVAIYISGSVNHVPIGNYRSEIGLLIMAVVISMSPNKMETLRNLTIAIFLWGLINAIIVISARLGMGWGDLVLFNKGGRSIGLTGHSTFMGAYFSIALIAVQMLFIQQSNKTIKLVLFSCGMLIMLGLLSTVARGAFIGWLVGFLYIQYRMQGMKLGSLVGIIVSVFIGIGVASMVGLDQLLLDRFTGLEKDSSAQARLPLLLSSLETISKNLFLGTGVGWFDAKMLLQSHNTFMQVLVESGVIGFILFMIILWKGGWNLLNRSKSESNMGFSQEKILNTEDVTHTGSNSVANSTSGVFLRATKLVEENKQNVSSATVTLKSADSNARSKVVISDTVPYYTGLVAMLGAILLNGLTHSFDFFLPYWTLLGVGFMRIKK